MEKLIELRDFIIFLITCAVAITALCAINTWLEKRMEDDDD